MEISRHHFVSPISDLCHIILNTAPIKPLIFPGEMTAQTKDRLNKFRRPYRSVCVNKMIRANFIIFNPVRNLPFPAPLWQAA